MRENHMNIDDGKDHTPIKENKMARAIADKRFKGKRNAIVDAFIEVLNEDPDIVIEYVTETGVEWNFKPDSEPVKTIAGEITSLADMDKYQSRDYDKMYKKYEREAIVKAKDKLGTVGVLKAVMGK